MSQSQIQSLCQFLKKSPTAWHACHEIAKELKAHSFHELDEDELWKLRPSGKYFIQRGASIIAFQMPKKKIHKTHIFAAHTDSPALKVKPNGEFEKDNCQLLNFEVYSSPVLSSWFGRSLMLAGKIFYESEDKIRHELVSFDDYPIMIPNIAIHLERNQNETTTLNKQEHLTAITSLGNKSFLQQLFGKKKILHTELYAVPMEVPTIFGANEELLSGYRLDNLVSCSAILEVIRNQMASVNDLRIAIFWNHEEIGSQTKEGAASPFFEDILERICYLQGYNKEEYLCLKARSQMISLDVAHGTHPNFSDKHDPRHKTNLGSGVVIKTSAQQKYAMSGKLTAALCQKLKKESIPYTTFVPRSDMTSGSTVGPIFATRTGIEALDIGIPLVGMHAAQELIATSDYEALIKALSAYEE